MIEETSLYRLGIIELDPQGWFSFTSRDQIRAVEELIVAESGLTETADPKEPYDITHGVILTAFVHGWKHNAEYYDKNAENFRGLLADLARNENARADKAKSAPRKVIGVYIGWPGLRATVEPLKFASFYSRKNVGDNVGYRGGVTEILTRLDNLQRKLNAAADSNRAKQSPAGHASDRSYYVVGGHSFGAQVVYNSVAAIMTERLVQAQMPQEVRAVQAKLAGRAFAASPPEAPRQTLQSIVKPFGDIVLLLNPAFEASRYYNLQSLAKQMEYLPEQRPAVAIFSSENDLATRYAFPVGRFFSTRFSQYREDDKPTAGLRDPQRKSNLRTVAWTDDFVTHTLVKAKDGPTPSRGENTVDLMDAAATWSRKLLHRTEEMKDGDCRLEVYSPPGQPARPWTPFYVVKVQDDILGNHGDIWNDNFRNFLVRFITISTGTEKP